MQLSIIVSTHQASFNAVADKGNLAANLFQVAALDYDGVEPAIRDPGLVDPEQDRFHVRYKSGTVVKLS